MNGPGPEAALINVLCPLEAGEPLSAHTSCWVFLECDQDGTDNLLLIIPISRAPAVSREPPVDVNSCYVIMLLQNKRSFSSL